MLGAPLRRGGVIQSLGGWSEGKGGELLIIPEAGHVFNFIDKDKGTFAWEKTILFLNQHLLP